LSFGPKGFVWTSPRQAPRAGDANAQCCSRANVAQEKCERYPGRSSREPTSADRQGERSNITRPRSSGCSSHTASAARRAAAAGAADAIPPFALPAAPPAGSGGDAGGASRTEARAGPIRPVTGRLWARVETACAGEGWYACAAGATDTAPARTTSGSSARSGRGIPVARPFVLGSCPPVSALPCLAASSNSTRRECSAGSAGARRRAADGSVRVKDSSRRRSSTTRLTSDPTVGVESPGSCSCTKSDLTAGSPPANDCTRVISVCSPGPSAVATSSWSPRTARAT
jgi:hypothetical protein